MESNQFLTVKEAADILKLHIITVYELIKANRLHALKLGRTYRIDVKDFNTFIEENTL